MKIKILISMVVMHATLFIDHFISQVLNETRGFSLLSDVGNRHRCSVYEKWQRWYTMVKIVKMFLSYSNWCFPMFDLHYPCIVKTQCIFGQDVWDRIAWEIMHFSEPLRWANYNNRWHEWKFQRIAWLYRKWSCTLSPVTRWLYWGHTNARENQWWLNDQ